MLHMEQKNYKLEIVRVLDRKRVHARGVAVRLGMNLGKLERDEELSKGWVQIEHPLSIDTIGGRPRRYWADFKIKLKEEGVQLSPNCHQLKLESSDRENYRERIVNNNMFSCDFMRLPDDLILLNVEGEVL